VGSVLRWGLSGAIQRWTGSPLPWGTFVVNAVGSLAIGLAGATVLRGVEGFGAHSQLHSAKVLRLSEELPILIELVDREERIRAFLPLCDEMIGEGMITLEPVEVLKYQAPPPAGS